MNWENETVLVTGGASFIGSHLVEKLLDRGAGTVRIADDMSSGRKENLESVRSASNVEIGQVDLLDSEATTQALRGVTTVFHLAADHGGRGYVDTHQVNCARNMWMDQQLFSTAHDLGVERIVYASSGCVYPNHLQTDPEQQLYLTENLVGPPYDADNMYGWAKLMAEMTLRAYHLERGMKTASARYFTVYGPRGKVDHAIIMMLARAIIGQDPYEIWGDGSQVRNWTYVDDIAEGTIRCAEEIEDGSAINLGTMERNTVRDAAEYACNLAGISPDFKFLTHMPVGPVNRVADNELAFELLDWVPKTELFEGMQKTYDWMMEDRPVDAWRDEVEHKALER